MGTHSDLHENGSVIRYDGDILDPMEPRLFDVDWLKSEGHYLGASMGRGEAHFLSFNGLELVLRPFRRGGLVGKFNRDFYLHSGIERSRSFQEFELLSWMREIALPVPRPVAAQMVPYGMVYRAALVTERIPDARPMEECLRDGPLAKDVWQRAGAVIRQLHDAGVYHSDLNCRNILIDDAQKIWLIDFDKCERRDPGAWTGENLDRLQRSLRKEAGKGGDFHWAEDEWAFLLTGYDGVDSGGVA